MAGAGRFRPWACLLPAMVAAGFMLPVRGLTEPDLDPRVERLVAGVSEERLMATLKKLEAFGTRNTMSSTTSAERGIGAAREWILEEMKRIAPRLLVSFDTYIVAKQGRITHDVKVRNVMAVLPGRSPRRIYVSGHYDTIAIQGGQGAINATGRSRDAIVVAHFQPGRAKRLPRPGRQRRWERHCADHRTRPPLRRQRDRI